MELEMEGHLVRGPVTINHPYRLYIPAWVRDRAERPEFDVKVDKENNTIIFDFKNEGEYDLSRTARNNISVGRKLKSLGYSLQERKELVGATLQARFNKRNQDLIVEL